MIWHEPVLPKKLWENKKGGEFHCKTDAAWDSDVLILQLILILQMESEKQLSSQTMFSL